MDENSRQAAVQFHHVATEGVLCTKSECLLFTQSLQLAWQLIYRRHFGSTHKNGDDVCPMCERSCELNTHNVLGIVETTCAATCSDPGRTNQDEDDHHSIGSEKIVNIGAEVLLESR